MTRSVRGRPDLAPGPARDLVDLFLRLRRARDDVSRQSIRQLAGRAGLSAGHLSDILNGWKTPSPKAASRIAAALNATAEQLADVQVMAERLAELNKYNRRKAAPLTFPWVVEPV